MTEELKPHQIAQLVNKLRDIATKYHAHGCLRELISREVNAALTQRPAAQSERIAELEARVHTCGPTCSKAGCINRRVTAERDQLRAEVERTSNNRDMWKGQCERQAEQLAQIRLQQGIARTHKETE